MDDSRGIFPQESSVLPHPLKIKEGKKMAEKCGKAGVKKQDGWLYFVDKDGDISRVAMARGGGKAVSKKKEKCAKVGVRKQSGYLYFVDKDGDISRAKMARGR